jgi:hypothetical protein
MLMERAERLLRERAAAAGARQHTSVGEAAGGHTGGAEGASDGNHGDGVDGRSGDELEMNWSFNGWGWWEEDGGDECKNSQKG